MILINLVNLINIIGSIDIIHRLKCQSYVLNENNMK